MTDCADDYCADDLCTMCGEPYDLRDSLGNVCCTRCAPSDLVARFLDDDDDDVQSDE